MGQFQAMNKYLAVVVVLIIVCHEIVITQGRQIKALKKNEETSIDGTVPPLSEKAGDSATTTNQDDNDVSEDSEGDQVNAHRPTTPGNSPGVGHRKSEEGDNKDMKTKVHVALQSPPNVEYSLTEGSKTDFRPITPCFCRGIGHALHQEIKT